MLRSVLWFSSLLLFLLSLTTPSRAQSIAIALDSPHHIEDTAQVEDNSSPASQTNGLSSGAIADFLGNPSIGQIIEQMTDDEASVIGNMKSNPGAIAITHGNVTFISVPDKPLVKVAQPGMLLSLEVPRAAVTRDIHPTDLSTLLTGPAMEVSAIGDAFIVRQPR